MKSLVPALEHMPTKETQSGVYFVQSSGFFQELWTLFRHHWPLVTAIVLVVMSCVVAVLLTIEPRWRATAMIMIQSRTVSTVKVDPVLSKLPNEPDTVASELEVLHSRDLLVRLVNTLHLETYPEFNPNTPSGWRRLVQLTIDTLPLPAALVDLGNKLTIREPLRGESLANSVVDEVSQHLDIAAVGRSRVIKVTFTSKDRELSSRAANTLSELYVAGQSELKEKASEQANRWITDRLTQLSTEAGNAAKRVADFKAENGMIDGKDTSLIRQEISELDSQLTAAQVQRMALASKLENIGGKADATASSLVLASPIIQSLRQQQANLASENASLGNRLGDKMPKLQANNAQLADIDRRIGVETAKIVASVRSDFKTAQDHENALQQQLGKLKTEMAHLQVAEVSLHQLENEEHADRALYESFLQRSKETGADHSFQPADAVLMSHAATPGAPYFPDPSILLPGGLLGSFFLTFMVIVVMEARDRGFRSQAQVEKALNLPIIGIIPEFRREDRKLDGLPDPMSLMGSAMTDIFMRVGRDDASKVLLIASALPRESKTMTGLFLAKVAAMNGRRVLLIDADMRRSGLAKRLPSDGPGLSNLLTGIASHNEIISHDRSGMDFVSCGETIENPAGLLISKRMNAFLDYARDLYELVIIDSPAIMAGPDAAVLSQICDITLMIVRWARTPRQVTTVACQRLLIGGGKVVGAIITRIDLKRIGRYSMTDGLSYTKAMRNYYPVRRA